MSQDSTRNHELIPTVGWANVRLGQSIQEVQAAIAKLGFSVRVTSLRRIFTLLAGNFSCSSNIPVFMGVCWIDAQAYKPTEVSRQPEVVRV